MCKDCGCQEINEKKIKQKLPEVGSEKIVINQSLTQANDAVAILSSDTLKDKGILSVNIMGSPGSGKTTFVEKISELLGVGSVSVIQGDLESDVDKIRLEKKGIQTYQINTHSGCHLNSFMINKALLNINLQNKKYLFIENVGNLVCPAGVKIGQHMDVVISSTTEGSDKPKKYPYIFMEAGIIVVSKIDLAQQVDFDENAYVADIKKINGRANIMKVSSKEPKGFVSVAEFLIHEREHMLGHHHHHDMSHHTKNDTDGSHSHFEHKHDEA